MTATTVTPGTITEAVLKRISRFPTNGRTCAELEEDLGLPRNSVSARINDLRKKGLVADSGVTRKTFSGRQAIVWVA
jgi:DNA-binding IclR family transcriptional regulator